MQALRHGGDAPIQIGKADLQEHQALHTSGFDELKASGSRAVGRYAVISYMPAPDGQTRLGIVVGRKFNTRAVKRNRARRLIRESFRLLRNGFTGPIWIAIIARKYLHNCKLQDLQQDLVYHLTKEGVLKSVDQ